MNYRKFELLLTSLGFAVILATIIASFRQADYVEIVGQALFGPVIFAALHYGKRAGFVSAMTAALLFIIVKFYGNTQATDFAPHLILARTAIYGLVGIIGGEVAARMKYVLLKLEDDALIDEQTNLYSQSYTIKVIERNIQNYQRYFRSFSIAIIEIKHSKFDVFAWPHKKRVIAQSAAAIRDNVRIVDEVGHWGDGLFCVVMPDTVLTDAKIAAGRIRNFIIKQLKNLLRDVSCFQVEIAVMAYPEDHDKIAEFMSSGRIAGESVEENRLGGELKQAQV